MREGSSPSTPTKCPRVGTGIRGGLKIHCPQGRAGSIPVEDTIIYKGEQMISKYQLQHFVKKNVLSPLLTWTIPKEVRKEYGLTWYDKPSKRHRKWDTDYALAWDILLSIREFRKHNTMSCPSEFEEIEDWHKVLIKIELAYVAIIKESYILVSDETRRTIEEGRKLFHDYFFHFWD